MTAEELQRKQYQIHAKIKRYANKEGLSKQKPICEPICDGVCDIAGYLETKPRIMWILKEPYDDFTVSGKAKGGAWSFTKHFKNEDVWKDEDMWKLIIQVNSAIHNDCKWKDLNYIEDDPNMAAELKKTAYINVGKMPGDTSSPKNHMLQCYQDWKEIILEQIDLYAPDVIIFGYTFYLFKEDLELNDSPVSTVAGEWATDGYKKDNIIYIDAYHPSRKGGEDGGKDYVTSIVKTYKKLNSK